MSLSMMTESRGNVNAKSTPNQYICSSGTGPSDETSSATLPTPSLLSCSQGRMTEGSHPRGHSNVKNAFFPELYTECIQKLRDVLQKSLEQQRVPQQLKCILRHYFIQKLMQLNQSLALSNLHQDGSRHRKKTLNCSPSSPSLLLMNSAQPQSEINCILSSLFVNSSSSSGAPFFPLGTGFQEESTEETYGGEKVFLPSLRFRAWISLLLQFLKTHELVYSLSVLFPESRLTEADILEGTDICKALSLPNIFTKTGQQQPEVDEGEGEKRKESLLEKIVEFLVQRHQHDGTKKSKDESLSTSKTDGADVGVGPTEKRTRKVAFTTTTQGLPGTNEGDNVKSKLQLLESAYQSKLEACRSDRKEPHVCTEQRLLEFQRGCEERYREQFEKDLCRMRELEMSTIRLEEAAKARQQLQEYQKELDNLHTDKVQRLKSQEEKAAERLKKRQVDVEKKAFLLRQEIVCQLQEVQRSAAMQKRQRQIEEQGLETRATALETREARLKEAEKCHKREKEEQACRQQAEASLDERQQQLHREQMLLKKEQMHFTDMKERTIRLEAHLEMTEAMNQKLKKQLIQSHDQIAQIREEARLKSDMAVRDLQTSESLRTELRRSQQEAAAFREQLALRGSAEQQKCEMQDKTVKNFKDCLEESRRTNDRLSRKVEELQEQLLRLREERNRTVQQAIKEAEGQKNREVDALKADVVKGQTAMTIALKRQEHLECLNEKLTAAAQEAAQKHKYLYETLQQQFVSQKEAYRQMLIATFTSSFPTEDLDESPRLQQLAMAPQTSSANHRTTHTNVASSSVSLVPPLLDKREGKGTHQYFIPPVRTGTVHSPTDATPKITRSALYLESKLLEDKIEEFLDQLQEKDSGNCSNELLDRQKDWEFPSSLTTSPHEKGQYNENSSHCPLGDILHINIKEKLKEKEKEKLKEKKNEEEEEQKGRNPRQMEMISIKEKLKEKKNEKEEQKGRSERQIDSGVQKILETPFPYPDFLTLKALSTTQNEFVDVDSTKAILLPEVRRIADNECDDKHVRRTQTLSSTLPSQFSRLASQPPSSSVSSSYSFFHSNEEPKVTPTVKQSPQRQATEKEEQMNKDESDEKTEDGEKQSEKEERKIKDDIEKEERKIKDDINNLQHIIMLEENPLSLGNPAVALDHFPKAKENSNFYSTSLHHQNSNNQPSETENWALTSSNITSPSSPTSLADERSDSASLSVTETLTTGASATEALVAANVNQLLTCLSQLPSSPLSMEVKSSFSSSSPFSSTEASSSFPSAAEKFPSSAPSCHSAVIQEVSSWFHAESSPAVYDHRQGVGCHADTSSSFSDGKGEKDFQKTNSSISSPSIQLHPLSPYSSFSRHDDMYSSSNAESVLSFSIGGDITETEEEGDGD